VPHVCREPLHASSMLFTRRNYTADEAHALVGREVRFTTKFKTTRGLPLKKGERGRVTGVLHQPDGELLVVQVPGAGTVYVGNSGAVEVL
jgi:glucose/arabinose dehydrogenase